jgi:menaquinone-dependent protoporphyrinogen IX oxidase
MKALVAYATRYGMTTKSASLIAEELRRAGVSEVSLLEARRVRRADLTANDAFIIGSSIAMGMWKGAAKRLVAKAALTGKPVAVFITAGGVLSGKEPGSDPDAAVTTTIEEREAKALTKYLEPVLAKTGLKPLATAAFGGRMVFGGKEQFNNWDGERVRSWAAGLATKLR